ncbi:unnamed protein product [Adineta ricciae]|uniref:Uncharacterized protein n=1 Tax=Adineta ricciae TaxID=249248 RepID=A0A815KND7_ADIRI|nr:unnamed protein product [Adineta ricciae]
MHRIIFLYFIILMMISTIYGLNCIVCSTITDIDCYDPYKGDLSKTSPVSQSGFTSCQKTMYWSNVGFFPSGTVVREGSNAPCISSSSTGAVATLYCCSDKDNCNSAMGYSVSLFMTISSILSCLIIKQILQY